MKAQYLVVEAPDSAAVVDFISRGVSVQIVIDDTKLFVHVQALKDGPGSSEFDYDTFEFDLPEYTDLIEPEEAEKE